MFLAPNMAVKVARDPTSQRQTQRRTGFTQDSRRIHDRIHGRIHDRNLEDFGKNFCEHLWQIAGDPHRHPWSRTEPYGSPCSCAAWEPTETGRDLQI